MVEVIREPARIHGVCLDKVLALLHLLLDHRMSAARDLVFARTCDVVSQLLHTVFNAEVARTPVRLLPSLKAHFVGGYCVLYLCCV